MLVYQRVDVFTTTLGIESPSEISENGNGTQIPIRGGDYAPQSSSDKVIGSLGLDDFCQ